MVQCLPMAKRTSKKEKLSHESRWNKVGVVAGVIAAVAAVVVLIPTLLPSHKAESAVVNVQEVTILAPVQANEAPSFRVVFLNNGSTEAEDLVISGRVLENDNSRPSNIEAATDKRLPETLTSKAPLGPRQMASLLLTYPYAMG